MRRKLIGLLCACILLSGCGSGSSVPLQTESPATEPMPTQSQFSLLEQRIAPEEGSNLCYIPNAAVESMSAPEVRLFGHGLLLSECVDKKMILKHISLEDGALVAEGVATAAAGTKLCIGSGEIGLCDRVSGRISILNEQFHLLRNYDIPGEGDDWYLNSELDTLYIFFSDRGLLAHNLLTGEDSWLVDNGFRVTPKGGKGSYIFFAYTDRADQKTYTRRLNLSTATMETLPIGGTVSAAVRQGETWLFQNNDHQLLVQGEAVRSFACQDAAIQLLSPKGHLLATDPSGRNLMLYESDGSFLSQCSLPLSSHAVAGSDFVWSGYWEGYFFTDFVDSSCRLMFWDVNADCAGEDLQMLQLGESLQSQPVAELSLYERAAQLSRRFGVDIRIAEQCTLDYTHYHTYEMNDPVHIRAALDIVEQSLSQYPEGFFRQLTYGSIESIRLELVGGLMLKPDVTTHTDSAGAFAQDMGSYYAIVLDGFQISEQTLFHEFSHIIDSRLAWDSLIREDALFSEEIWLNLQPKGFHYAMSYTEVPADLLSFMESRYFITDYALTYPTEDRARLMESAMCNFTWDFEPGTGTRAKLQYYADCIRDCFNTEGWPETVCWEQVLK